MTQEQRERLTAWCLNLFATYRIDFFRGCVISDVVNFLNTGDPYRIATAIDGCCVVSNLGFDPDLKDFGSLINELQGIAMSVPLSDTAQSAITYVFGGEWEDAIEALDKLKSERD